MNNTATFQKQIYTLISFLCLSESIFSLNKCMFKPSNYPNNSPETHYFSLDKGTLFYIIQAFIYRFLPTNVRLETSLCRILEARPGQIPGFCFFFKPVNLTPVRYNGGQVYIQSRNAYEQRPTPCL